MCFTAQIGFIFDIRLFSGDVGLSVIASRKPHLYPPGWYYFVQKTKTDISQACEMSVLVSSQWVHKRIRRGLLLISIKTSELVQNKSLKYDICTDYFCLSFLLKVFSLKQRVVGTPQWVNEHIRSGLVLMSIKTSELLQNKSLEYELA